MKALWLCALLASSASAWEKEKHLYEDVFTPFFVLDRSAGEYATAREGMEPQSFRESKSTDTFRVFLVGATTVHTYSGAQDLQHALQLVLPGVRVEVLRCGLSGYDSYREAIVLKEILGYSPDLVVLMGGINELQSLYYPLPPWILQVDDVYGAGEWRPRLDQWLKDNPGASAKTWPSRRAARLEEFRANLRTMIRLAKARGVRVAVASPPINYRDNAPEAPLPWRDAAFTRAWVRYLRGDFKGAGRVWTQALPGSGPLKPLTLFYLGRSAERSGDTETALRRYSESLDAADYRFCSPSCARMMAETSEQEGAAWVDLDAAFRRAAFPRAPGLDMFMDQNQWKSETGTLVSLELVSAIHKDGRFAALPWDAGRLSRLSNDLDDAGRSIDPRVSPPPLEYTLHFALWELQNRKKPEDLLWPSLTWFETAFEREPEWFKDTGGLFSRIEAKDKRRPPREKDSGDGADMRKLKAQFYWHIGEVRLRRKDYRGALADFNEALSLDGNLHPVLLSRAVAEALSGDKPASLRTLAAARKEGLSAESRSLTEALRLAAR